MEKEKDFKECALNIKAKLKDGDMAAIARENGFTPRLLEIALKGNSWDELTSGQDRAIRAAVEYITKREEIKQIAAAL